MAYGNIFLRTLTEELGDYPDQRADRQELNNSLNPDDDMPYDIKGPDVPATETAQRIKSSAEQWAERIDGFVKWLNATDGSSLLTQVQKAGKHPGFEGIGDATQKEIGKVAAQLAGLTQKVNMFINTADTKIDRAMEDS